jgi:chromosome segregation ATPase
VVKSKLTLVIIGGLLFLFPYILIERSCDARLGEDIAELQGLYDARSEEIKEKEEEWAEERKALAEEIEKWIGEAIEWEDHAEKKTDEAEAKDVVVAKLRAEYKKLEDKDEKIQNLLSQNIALEEQYHNMQEAYGARGQEILRLKSVIDNKDIIIMGLEERLRDKDTLLKLSEELAAKQRKRITSLKTGRTLSQILAIGGWSVALYKTVIG